MTKIEMDIPADIKDKIKHRAQEIYPTGYTTSGNGFRHDAFIIGAIFGYNLKLEEKDKEIALLNSTLDIQHKLMINAEQRGIDKAKEELEEKDNEIFDLKKEIELLKSVLNK